MLEIIILLRAPVRRRITSKHLDDSIIQCHSQP
jgi:hypothetical protein